MVTHIARQLIKISEDYGCEILYKVENSGTPEDIENIKKAIGA